VCDDGMEQFSSKHADKIEGTLSRFDRILFRGSPRWPGRNWPWRRPCGKACAIFGNYQAGIAAGRHARHDHGSQYMSDYF
jgi:hypothetical protein